MRRNKPSQPRSIEMTTGSLWRNILLFSLPLMLTQVLEVLFNLSDVAIAGKFAGYVALGAVGSTTLLVSLFTGLLIGMGAGVNVAIARSLGLGDDEQLERTLHTSFLICACAGLLVCLVCAGLAGPMLRMLHTKGRAHRQRRQLSAHLCAGSARHGDLQLRQRRPQRER